jgi:hypothetical protein
MKGNWGEGEEDENYKIIASDILPLNCKLNLKKRKKMDKTSDFYVKTDRFKSIIKHLILETDK